MLEDQEVIDLLKEVGEELDELNLDGQFLSTLPIRRSPTDGFAGGSHRQHPLDGSSSE